MNTNGIFSSKSNEWSTPQDLFDKLDQVFHFTLDAASTHENAKCKNHFTIEEDGLKQDWTGTVWCNPPYGREIGKWCKKAYKEFCRGGCTIVMLLPVRTDTKWFHEYVYGKCEIKFLKKRLKFGNATQPAPFPSMIAIYR